MILSDKTMLKMLEEKALVISPLEESQIQPASVDVRLGNTFGIVEDTPTGVITLDSEVRYKTIETDTYILLPGQFVLATTMEYFELPDNITAFVEGRSSLGRMGLFIQNAGWVDPGFRGEITLAPVPPNRSQAFLYRSILITACLSCPLAREGVTPKVINPQAGFQGPDKPWSRWPLSVPGICPDRDAARGCPSGQIPAVPLFFRISAL